MASELPTTLPKYPLDYIFINSYPISFITAILFIIHSFVDLKSISSQIDNNILLVIKIYILMCAIFSMILWIQPSNIEFVSKIINLLRPIYNINTIRTSSNS
jgi:hypothetical protein